MDQKSPSNSREIAVICMALAGLVALVFSQTIRFGFVYDDAMYIVNNPTVQRGLTPAGIQWAFTYGEIGHWHPVTWLTHMLDCQFYGLWAGGHHLTNVVLQAVAAVLLFLVLSRATGARWRSAFVAAAWAVHPLRAESVAWIAERKDVLSAVMFLLALWAYLAWVERPSAMRRWLVIALFAIGLLCKNMLVTFPCVLLLLDYWPLKRDKKFSALVLEKIPLFLLSAFSCVITLLVPEEISHGHKLSVAVRLENAILSCGIYLRQSFWPTGLSPNYPNSPQGFPILLVAGVFVLHCAISFLAVRERPRRPWFFTGWFWFLGMLVPVLGLTQISHYAHADRYTYLPQIGLLIAFTWLVADFLTARKLTRVAAPLALMTLGLLVIFAYRQVSFWRDDPTLWTRALACNPHDALAHNNLGADLFEQGDLEGAAEHYRQAVESDPYNPDSHYNLGLVLNTLGNPREAIPQFQETLHLVPGYVKAHSSLGSALLATGDTAGAIDALREALRLDPNYAPAHNGMGNALLAQHDIAGAIAQFHEALRINPRFAEAHNNLGNALADDHRLKEAVAEYAQAVQIQPGNANAWNNLGSLLFRGGNTPGAIECLGKALDLQPENPAYQNGLALVLATAPQTKLRDGPRALALATAAAQATSANDPLILRTLAAAYAENDRFAEAAATAQKAIALTEARHEQALLPALQRELLLYQANRRFEAAP